MGLHRSKREGARYSSDPTGPHTLPSIEAVIVVKPQEVWEAMTWKWGQNATMIPFAYLLKVSHNIGLQWIALLQPQ